MAIIVAFMVPVAVIVLVVAAKNFNQYCKENSHVNQAILNKR